MASPVKIGMTVEPQAALAAVSRSTQNASPEGSTVAEAHSRQIIENANVKPTSPPEFVAVEIQSEQQQQPAPPALSPPPSSPAHEEKGALLELPAADAVADAAVEKDSMEEDGKVCRVCHLSLPVARFESEDGMEAIELGCGCKDDLSIAHRRCAETWFKIKGNRSCEICGQLVQNVSAGFDDYSCGRRSDEQSDSLFNNDAAAANNGESRSFWHHRPICNFVLAFIVVILLLPWLFRIHLF